MGFWSASINGNDIVQDLLMDYSICFSKYPIEVAVDKLNSYAKENFDDWDYKHYIYSLADYMWRHGILTDGIKEVVLNQVEHDDLAEYEEVDQATMRSRKKVLEKFVKKIKSQQPAPKKITLKINPNYFLCVGDICTLKLLSKGKYILIQKVYDSEATVSKINPEIKDIFPHFLLLDYYSEKMPTLEDAINAKPVTFASYVYTYYLEGKIPMAKENVRQRSFMFYCEGKPFHFKRRKYSILGNLPVKSDDRPRKHEVSEFCNIWREDDEQTLENAINLKFSLFGNRKLLPHEFENYEAIVWLNIYNEEFRKNIYPKYEEIVRPIQTKDSLASATINYMIKNGFCNKEWK